VGRDKCHVCLLLEQYYRLTIKDAMVAAKTAQCPPPDVIQIDENLKAKERMLRAGRALIAHWQVCEECKRPWIA
jgi:hypothetical protein